MRIPNHLSRGGLGFNMTPMIDVVFLLIIFFLVSSIFPYCLFLITKPVRYLVASSNIFNTWSQSNFTYFLPSLPFLHGLLIIL